MINRATKLRWRRRIKRSKLQVEDYNQSAEMILQKNLFRRLDRLSYVRRFILSWIGLVVLLIVITVVQAFSMDRYYQSITYVPGGNFYEGAIGSFTNVNPLFANGDVNTTVSKLLFPGLFKYDQDNQLVGDLAQSWSVDASGQNYTVILKKNLKWQDGQPLTADDVVYTYSTIEDPDTQSDLFNDWYGIKVTTVNSSTVMFSLPSPLSSFPYALTNGIIPKHILADTLDVDLQSSNFNDINPIGSGPFKLQTIQSKDNLSTNPQLQITLTPNLKYYGGTAKLNSYNLLTYSNQSKMISAFEKQDIQAMAGIDSVPNILYKDNTVDVYNIPITAETMLFYRNLATNLNSTSIRKALTEAINTTQVINQLQYPTITLHGPFLPSQFTYNPTYNQSTNNLVDANKLLDSLGWLKTSNGYRFKDKQQLEFSLYTPNTPDYENVANNLVDQWKAVGVKVQLHYLQSSLDIKNAIAEKSYDMILYSIDVGVDPDVLPYWYSSQAVADAVPGLNLSQYESTTADNSLASGRTRFTQSLRIVKYQPFSTAWQSDYPALALYEPNYIFVTRPKIDGFNQQMVNDGVDIYSNVNNWEIKQVEVTNN
jgi:peptide/nickel transport system substrate-binding protein